MNDYKKRKSYEKARKQVEKEKKFYSHLTVYIVINCIIILLRIKAEGFLGVHFGDEGFKNWLDWNIISTPLLWGIGLFIHWIVTFKRDKIINKWFNKSVFSKEWEERKINDLMDKDDF